MDLASYSIHRTIFFTLPGFSLMKLEENTKLCVMYLTFLGNYRAKVGHTVVLIFSLNMPLCFTSELSLTMTFFSCQPLSV